MLSVWDKSTLEAKLRVKKRKSIWKNEKEAPNFASQEVLPYFQDKTSTRTGVLREVISLCTTLPRF